VENQTGSAQYAGAQDGWYSAQWQLTSTTVSRSVNQQPVADIAVTQTASFNIFPNPAIGKTIHIVATLPIDGKAYTLSVYDLQGRVITTRRIASGTVELSLPASGIYLVEMTGDNIKLNKKVIVQ
jgi:hypothetical protein